MFDRMENFVDSDQTATYENYPNYSDTLTTS